MAFLNVSIKSMLGKHIIFDDKLDVGFLELSSDCVCYQEISGEVTGFSFADGEYSILVKSEFGEDFFNVSNIFIKEFF